MWTSGTEFRFSIVLVVKEQTQGKFVGVRISLEMIFITGYLSSIRWPPMFPAFRLALLKVGSTIQFQGTVTFALALELKTFKKGDFGTLVLSVIWCPQSLKSVKWFELSETQNVLKNFHLYTAILERVYLELSDL